MTVSPASSPVAASHHDRTLCTALHLPPSSASTPRNTIPATRIPPHPILASNAVDEAVVASKGAAFDRAETRSEEHTSELQSLMRISYAVFCLKKKTKNKSIQQNTTTINSPARANDKER